MTGRWFIQVDKGKIGANKHGALDDSTTPVVVEYYYQNCVTSGTTIRLGHSILK